MPHLMLLSEKVLLRFIVIWMGVAALYCGPFAQGQDKPLPPLFDPARHMSLAEVKPGMTGHGLSVFKGAEIERFHVEVLSILRKVNPKHDVILIRFGGANLEHTGGIAGMSGSPIYLKDEAGRERLAGAFAYAWPLQKDPVGGVQPIEYMLALPERGKEQAVAESAKTSVIGAPAGWKLSDLAMPPRPSAAPHGYPLSAWNRPFPDPTNAKVDATRLQPMATPLMTAGLAGRVLQEFGPLFQAHGLVPLQAGGGAGDNMDARIAPGSVIAVPLLSGDIDMTAIGTVTEVIGDRVWAFGHSFNNEGLMEMPFGAGQIHSVVANMFLSFKIGSLTQLKGTLGSDQISGIAGRLGDAPPMAPIDLTVNYADGSFSETYHCKTVRHAQYTPLISGAALAAAVTGVRELPPFHTLDYNLKLQFSNGQTIDIQNRSVNSSVGELFFELAIPMMAAANNPFEQVMLDKFTGTLTVRTEAREGNILSVNVPKLKYRPGETLKGYVSYRPFRAAEAHLPLEFLLPRDLPDGEYQLVISDSERYLADEMAAKPFRFAAENATEVFDVLRDVASVRHDAIYVRLLRQPDGVAIGRTAMPHLPSSRREIYLGSGRSNTTPFVSSTVKTIPTDLVMRGSADFVIEIDKDVRVERAGRAEPAKVDLKDAKEPAEKQPAKEKEQAPGKEPAPKSTEEPAE